MNNYNTTDHILWTHDEEETPERDLFDEADMEYSQYKLDKYENSKEHRKEE